MFGSTGSLPNCRVLIHLEAFVGIDKKQGLLIEGPRKDLAARSNQAPDYRAS